MALEEMAEGQILSKALDRGLVVAESERQPWERQEGEGAKAFSAFCIYRDMGAKRSLRKTAQAYYERKSRVNLGQVERWSVKYRWVERAPTWDDHCDRIRREMALEETIEEMAQRHIEAGKRLEERGLELLSTIRRATAQGVARLVTAGVELQRLARGEPTERLELKGALLDAAIERELAKLAGATEEELSGATGEGAEGD